MKTIKPMLIVAALAASLQVKAGILAHGAWSPENCGAQPEPPSLDSGSVDRFNQSVAEVNAWQQKAKSYYECLVDEANKDNAVIADTANQAQAGYRTAIEKINRESQAAKKKLDGK